MATLTERDYELLSSYLDGALSPAERSGLEQRLEEERLLQSELESLRQTVALLGMAERLPVPRAFTLDPAVYGRKARSGLLDRFNLNWMMPLVAAGAMAAMTLVVVSGVLLVSTNRSRLAGVSNQGDVAVADAPVEAPAAEAPPQEALSQAESAAEPAGEAEADQSVESLAVEEATEETEEPESGYGGGGGPPVPDASEADTGLAEGGGGAEGGMGGGGIGGDGPPGQFPPMATESANLIPPDDSASRVSPSDGTSEKMFGDDDQAPTLGAEPAGTLGSTTADDADRRAARTLTLVIILGAAGAAVAAAGLVAILIARRR